MGKNSKNKESPNKNMKGGDKMDIEEFIVSGKRGRENSNEDSSSDLGKKPNKIPTSIASSNDNSEGHLFARGMTLQTGHPPRKVVD